MKLSMKQKLVLLLIGTISLALVLTGILLTSLQYRVFRQETIDNIHKAHAVLMQNLQTYKNDLKINGAEIAQNTSIISSVNMISEYPSVADYQPLIFDEEKKTLATHLSGLVAMADFDLVSLYDAGGELITFRMQKDFGSLVGIVSYRQAESFMYLSANPDSASWREAPLPPLVSQHVWQKGGEAYSIQYIRVKNGFTLVLTLPIVRVFPDSTTKTIGFVEISNYLGKDFADSISMQTQMGFQLATPDVTFGDLQLSDHQQQLSHNSHVLTDDDGSDVNYFENTKYFLHSHILLLHDGSHVYFIFGRDKEILQAQLRNVQLSVLLVLLCTGLICIPLGIYVAQKTITVPIERLIDGVNALSKGSYESPIPVVVNGELGALTRSFNDMGLAIKQREAGLQRAKEEWERTFDSISDIITIQDKEFRIVMANQATCDFLGLGRDEIQGKLCHELFHDISTPCLGCPTLKTLEDKKHHSAEMVCGHQMPKKNMLLSSSPMFDDEGECIGIVYSAKDITKTKELESRLRQAQKMEAIGTLAGGIAHDFNNILTPILGYSEMLMESLPVGSPERADDEQIVKAAKRAKELVKQILTFSRQTEQERKPVQIHFIIKEALKLLRSSLSANIEIKQNIHSDCCQVLADPTQVHQVLMNLCTNSYHAMRDTGGILTVGLSEVEITPEDYSENLSLQTGQYIKLTVSDTGHGMDKVLVDKIFDPYFTTKKKGEGTGLGLSVVHGIIKSHHGQVTVYSEPRQGTEFHVYLPCVEAPVSSHLSKLQDIPLGRQEKVLVVDDEEPIAELLGNLLTRLGYVVIQQSNSAAALEIFKDKYKSIDLVVTDMSMPGMSGAELAAELLKIKPGLPIILCTGFSEIINEEKAKAAGFTGFLLKPVLKSQLAHAVKDALGG